MIQWEDYKQMVYSVAKKHFYRAQTLGVDFTDLIQAGRVGLLVAIKEYKDDGRAKFSTYAYICIKHSIRQELCKANLVHVPPNVDRDVCRLVAGHEHSIKPIYLKCVKHAHKVLSSRRLNAGSVSIATNPVDDPVIIASQRDELNWLYMMVDKLTDEDAKLIRARYLSGDESMGQKEIAASIGITKAAVSTREIRAIKRLKELVAGSHCDALSKSD